MVPYAGFPRDARRLLLLKPRVNLKGPFTRAPEEIERSGFSFSYLSLRSVPSSCRPQAGCIPKRLRGRRECLPTLP